MEITIAIRSGIVTGFIEAVFLLVISPIISRATARVYNYMTTCMLLAGRKVKIRDNSTSVEDLVPRSFQAMHALYRKMTQQTSEAHFGVARLFVTVSISLFLTTGMFLLGTFTDGRTEPVFKNQSVAVWNGGRFVDTSTLSGLDGQASDIAEMTRVRIACIVPYESFAYKLHAVGFQDPQLLFEDGGDPDSFICLDGTRTKQTVGIELYVQDKTIIPAAQPVSRKDMGGQPASFQFIQNMVRSRTPNLCRVNVTSGGETMDWAFSQEDSASRTRFAVRAMRNESDNNAILVKVGVAYHFLDSDQTHLVEVQPDCSQLSLTMFADNRFTAKIQEDGVELNLRHLEMVILDMLVGLVKSGYERSEPEEVMFHAYYAGVLHPNKDGSGDGVKFKSKQIDLNVEMRQITVMADDAVVGLYLTIIGTLILVIVSVPLQPVVRMTSPAYISALYSSNRVGGGDGKREAQSDLLEITERGGHLHVGVVPDTGGARELRVVDDDDVR